MLVVTSVIYLYLWFIEWHYQQHTLCRAQCLGDCELQTGKDVERSSLGIIYGTILTSTWWD